MLVLRIRRWQETVKEARFVNLGYNISNTAWRPRPNRPHLQGATKPWATYPYGMPSHYENVNGEEDFTWTHRLVQVKKR